MKYRKTHRGKFGAVLVLAALLSGGCRTRQAAGPQGGAHPPPTSPVQFRDVAPAAGLDYAWTIAGPRPLNILQTIGNGCAFLDYDNDGSLDVLCVGPKLALFKGDGRGRFTDVSRATGLAGLSGHFLGCAVGDYDNDGWDDVYVSGYRTGLLLHNAGGKAFTDVTQAAGLAPQPWGTSCAWADVDGDGKLELFVANYARYGTEPGIPQLCDSHGVKTSCGPRYYKPLQGVLYRNLGAGRFADASRVLDLKSTSGRGLGVAFAPLDDSGRPTLAISNDELPGDLLTPGAKGKYANMGSPSGTAFDRDGNIHGGMGADWGDYDNDGRFDLFVGTFQNEAKSFYHNDGGGVFSDASYMTGLAPPTIPNVAFGVKLLDADNDGRLDVMIANGHVQDNIHDIDTSTTYRQTTQVFHNKGGTPPAFDNVSPAAGPDFARAIVGRGLAVGDYDNDGRVDALVVDSEGKPLLLHNESAPVGHWLSVRLEGKKSNRDGLGAVLTATAAGQKLVRLCQTDGSYLSASDRRVHFGLGPAGRLDTLTVRWPDGHADALNNVPADRVVTLREGAGIVSPP